MSFYIWSPDGEWSSSNLFSGINFFVPVCSSKKLLIQKEIFVPVHDLNESCIHLSACSSIMGICSKKESFHDISCLVFLISFLRADMLIHMHNGLVD